MTTNRVTRVALNPGEQPDPKRGRYLWLFVRLSAAEPWCPYSGPGSQPLDLRQAPPDHPATGAAHPDWRAVMATLEEFAATQGNPRGADTLYWAQTSTRLSIQSFLLRPV